MKCKCKYCEDVRDAIDSLPISDAEKVMAHGMSDIEYDGILAMIAEDSEKGIDALYKIVAIHDAKAARLRALIPEMPVTGVH